MKNNFHAEHQWPVNSTNTRTTRTGIHKILFSLAVLLGMFMPQLNAQGQADDPCQIDECHNNVLNISTGYDQTSATYNTPLALETNWTLVAVPTNAAITLPAPCWDITPHPAWSNFPNATWVSPFQNNAYWVNNWPPALYGAFEFQKCFCVCDYTTLNINFEMLVDDGAEVLLDGVTIATAFSGYQFQWANRLIVNTNVNVGPGQHCLTVKLYNSGSVAMGFAIEGNITGANLLSSVCCTPQGRICGTKIQDTDCDGAIDPATDPGLSGWTIQLYDNIGNLLATTVTDAFGNYCFTGLAPGTYVVAEVNQPGWTQTYPASGTHTINLPAGGAATANFGNCGDQTPPCNFELQYNLNINMCSITASPVIVGIPAGYYVVSTEWTFGDGYSSNSYNATHYYSAPGTYTVCLKVTIFNGEECCTRTYCKDIDIHEECNRDCVFEAEMIVNFNPHNCIYEFDVNVLFAGAPITAWFWDFGDGTTGTGTPITHQFPGPGTYTVCLYIFSNIGDRCCFYKVCRRIRVDCDPCGGKDGTGIEKSKQQNNIQPSNIELTDKNFVILNQNVPNPFAESTVITYNIQQNFNKAEIVFTNVDGRVIKTFSITQKGEGRVNVFADDLTSGVYLYSLVIDGKTMESKRMLKH